MVSAWKLVSLKLRTAYREKMCGFNNLTMVNFWLNLFYMKFFHANS